MSELERLQRRAYEPGADIAGDAAAMARLSQLEAAQREPDSVVEAPTSPWWRRRPRLTVRGSAAALALIGALVAFISQQLAPWSTQIETDTSMATMLPTGPATQGPPVLTPDDVLRPHYVLALKSVGLTPIRPQDPHGTLNWPGLNTGELARNEDFRGLGVWGGKSRHGTSVCWLPTPARGSGTVSATKRVLLKASRPSRS